MHELDLFLDYAERAETLEVAAGVAGAKGRPALATQLCDLARPDWERAQELWDRAEWIPAAK